MKEAQNKTLFRYRKWCQVYDNSTELSARAVFLLWWLDRNCAGKTALPMWFPLPIGNLQPIDASDAAFIEVVEKQYASVRRNENSGREIELTENGKLFLTSHICLSDQLDGLFEIKGKTNK